MFTGERTCLALAAGQAYVTSGEGNRCPSPKRGKIGGDIREGFAVHQIGGFDLQRPDAALCLGIMDACSG
jgi:hypothetical protein